MQYMVIFGYIRIDIGGFVSFIFLIQKKDINADM